MNVELIEEKELKLKLAGESLKNHFIGIDHIIDQLIEALRVWYIMPELLTRPTIINLWGMTGVGKTDLVRRLVKAIDFHERYLEIELSNIDETSYQSSIFSILSDSKLNDQEPNILLFDEIQKFYTLDVEGAPLQKTKFSDFWELLSDGKLSRKIRGSLHRYIFDFSFAIKSAERNAKVSSTTYESTHLEYYEAEQIHSLLSSDVTIEELAKLTKKEVLDLLIIEKENQKTYDPIDHKKSLIIISGNLDEAFIMANQISEADVDADIFHAFTKQINIVDIKNALAKKFRPEEVARFGNIHLIYTSLCKSDFKLLIEREVDKIKTLTKTNYDIDIEVSENLLHLIYRNGVFPAQGVRPVFSSIIDILESRLPIFLLDAIKTKSKTIYLDYINSKSQITYSFNNEVKTVNYIGKVDKIRQSNTKDAVADISVHEAGHAVVYMYLFKLSPLQLKSKIASSYAGGFTFPHQIFHTEENILKMIQVYLGGGLAEEVIFGKENASTGRNGDRMKVTQLAVQYIREMGFVDKFQAVYTLQEGLSMNKNVTDEVIEKLLSAQVEQTIEILTKYKSLLLELSKKLLKAGSLSSKEIQKIGMSHDLNVKIEPEAYLHIYNYHEHLK